MAARPCSGRIIPSANKNAVLPDPVRHAADARAGAPARRARHHRRAQDPRRSSASWAATCRVDFDTRRARRIHHEHTRFDPPRHHLPEEMRSSIMLVPPLLARFGVARLENDVQGLHAGRARDRSARRGVRALRRAGGARPRARCCVHARRPLHAHRPLARLRLGHHHRELRAVRRAGRRHVRR